MCTNSCTTDGICSASPATDGNLFMVRVFLVRGMLVGIVAGLFCFGFLKVYGEPQVDRAIAFETKLADAKAAAEKKPAMDGAETESPELVSRPTQAGLGLFTAVMLYCTA